MALPASEQKWADDNGGVIRVEGPDANGSTTYHTASGQYVVIRSNGTPAMRGASAGGAQQGAPADQAAAPTGPRGSGMTKAELEALLAQMGPLGAGDFREETKDEQIPNPKYDAADPANNQPTIKAPVTYRTWVKPGTNIRLTVKVNADGSYTQVFSGADSSINPNKPADNAPSREEVPVATHPGYIQVTVTDPTTKTTRRFYIGPDGKETNSLPQLPDQQVTVIPINGQRYTQIIKTPKDGSPPTVTFLGPDGKPVASLPAEVKPGQIIKGGGPNGEDIQAVTGQDGRISYQPIQGAPTAGAGAGVKNIPPFVPDYSKPESGLGLVEWAAELRKKVGLPAAQGGISQKEYEDAVRDAHTTASGAVATVQAAAETERQTLAAQRAEVARRQAQASNDFTSGQNANKEMWKYTAPGQATLDTLALGSVAANRGVQTMYGGTQDVPYPSLLNPWVEKMRQQLANGKPNALGLGNIGATAPGAPAPAPAPTTAAAPPSGDAQVGNAGIGAGPRPTAGEPGGPPLAPGPVLGDPAPAPNYRPDATTDPATTPMAPASSALPPPAFTPAPAVPALLPHEMTPPPNTSPTAPLPWMPNGEDDVMVQSTDENGQPNGQPVRMTRAEWEQLQQESGQPASSWNPLTNLLTPTPAPKKYIVTPVSTPRPHAGATPQIPVPAPYPTSPALESQTAPNGWSNLAMSSPIFGGAPQQQAGAAPTPWGQQAQQWQAGQMDPSRAAQSLKSIGIPDDIIGQVLRGAA